MRRFVALALIFAFTSLGCYNTYYIDRGQLAELQVVPETGKATVTDSKSKAVQVDDDTKLFVRSEGGKRYQLTPFNFTMTESQLVASDRDYILDMTELKEMAEVDHEPLEDWSFDRRWSCSVCDNCWFNRMGVCHQWKL